MIVFMWEGTCFSEVAHERKCARILKYLSAGGQFDSNRCAINLHLLLESFKSRVPDFKIENATVLLFYPGEKSRWSTILTFGKLLGRAPFFYHVALKVGDKVYDPSYSNPPVAMSMQKYIKEMFLGASDVLPEPHRADLVEIKNIPAAIWQSNFDPSGNVMGMVQDYIRSKQYKSTTLVTLLDQK